MSVWKRSSVAVPVPIEVVKVFLLSSLSPPELVFNKLSSWRDTSEFSSASIVVVGIGALEVKFRHGNDTCSNEDEEVMFEYAESRKKRSDGPHTCDVHLERLQGWTRLQQEEGKRWAAIFSPWLARFEEALDGARHGVDLSKIDDAPSGAICSASAGNPAIHFLQHLAESKQVSKRTASAILAGKDEYLKQCAVSVGWESLLLLLLAVRCAAAQSTTDETQTHLPAFVKDAAPILESLPSASSFISTRCSVTRADSPDLRAQALLARLIKDEDELEPYASQFGVAPLADPSSTAVGSFVFETSMAQRHALARSGKFKAFHDTGAHDGDEGQETIAGRVRLHFWDDFFAYRELGSVSKELVLGSAEASLKSLDILPSPEKSFRQDSSCSPNDTSSSFFASLKRRPRSPLHLHRSSKGFLRRPAAATAVPLPVSARRPEPKLPELTPRSEANKNLVAQTRTENHLVQEPKSPKSPSKDGRSKRGFKRIKMARSSARDLTLSMTDFSVPVFMGGKVQRQSESPALPFISNRIGFLPPAGRQEQSNSGLSSEVGPEILQEDKRGIIVETRCAYCRYHGMEADNTVPKTARRSRQLTSILRSGKVITAGTQRLCESCGDSVNAPMYRPDKASFVREVSTIFEQSSAEFPKAAKEAERSQLAEEKDADAETLTAQDMHPDPAATAHQQETSAQMEKKTLHREASAASAFGSTGHLDASSTLPYFRACERYQARPLARAAAALASSTGFLKSQEVSGSPRRNSLSSNVPLSLVFRSVGLDDRGLDALLETFVQAPNLSLGVVRVDLAGNLITDKGLAGLLGRLQAPLAWSLRLDTLDIAKNRHLTAYGLDPLLKLMMSEQLPRLSTLRIGGMELMDAFAQKFLGSVAAACAYTLKELDVSFCGIGRTGSAAPSALVDMAAQLFELQVLDASGNFLNSDWLAAFGCSLAEPCTVCSLHLAHNSGGWAPGDDPKNGGAMLAFVETLPGLKELQLLDLRSAEVDRFSAFALSQVLAMMPFLEALLLSGNPIGSFGLRCILGSTVLSRDADRQRLAGFVADAQSVDIKEADAPVRLADPSGSYSLELSDSWSRIILHFCLEKWAKMSSKLPFEQAFTGMTLMGKPCEPFTRKQDGRWDFPHSGTLAFTFLLPCKQAAASSEGYTMSSSLKADQAAREVRPQDRNREPLTAQLEERFFRFAATCNESMTLSAAIRAVAADFFVSASFAATMLSWLRSLTPAADPFDHMLKLTAQVLLDAVRVETVENCQDNQCLRMLDAMFTPEWSINTDTFVLQCFPGAAGHSLSRARVAPGALAATMDFVVAGNATGKYVLNLEVPSDHLVAEYMLRINAWEVELGKALSLADVSQAGNYQCIRNEELNRSSFTYAADWLLPPAGCFSFHFVAARRPLRRQKALSEGPWQKLLAVLEDATVPALVRILCLRRVSPAITISCQQLAAALSLFADEQQHVQLALLAVLFFRVTDYRNLRDPSAGIFAAGRVCGSKDMRDLCEHAFGRLNVVDPMRIHGNQFLLKLDTHEDWQLLKMILEIAFTEGGRSLVPDHFPVCAYGPYARDLEVMKKPPEAWLKAEPPRDGVLLLCYSNEAARVMFRKTMANKYCRWEV